MTTRKWCNACARFLDISEFWMNRSKPDRHQEWCKSCLRAWRYSYREIERAAERERDYQRRVERLNSGGPPAKAAGEY